MEESVGRRGYLLVNKRSKGRRMRRRQECRRALFIFIIAFLGKKLEYSGLEWGLGWQEGVEVGVNRENVGRSCLASWDRHRNKY